MRIEALSNARRSKNDEFYTQYEDIEKEMNAYLEFDSKVFNGKVILLPCDDPEWSNFTKYFAQNFEKLGLKKLISTSYAPESKTLQLLKQPTLFETESPQYNESKSSVNGKIFELYRDHTGDKRVDFFDLEWNYLEGDGDFRSSEITALRDEADVIITNPPFSLFRPFFTWASETNKQFVVIGNLNAITYTEVFPLIMKNKVWLGQSIHSGDREFQVPDSYPLESAGWRIDDNGSRFIRVKGVRWYTNIDHGRRHQPLPLMTMAENLLFSKHKEIKGKASYDVYDNFDAIEVPYTDAIPSDFQGVMGVPITFLDKYNPDQFEILGSFNAGQHGEEIGARKVQIENNGKKTLWNGPVVNGKPLYKRIVIRHRR
jgi:hypothetical protein